MNNEILQLSFIVKHFFKKEKRADEEGVDEEKVIESESRGKCSVLLPRI